MYYRNSSCAIVVYDITQKSSLDRARIWINELQSQSDDLLIALVGNKLDLEAERQVDNTVSSSSFYLFIFLSLYRLY